MKKYDCVVERNLSKGRMMGIVMFGWNEFVDGG